MPMKYQPYKAVLADGKVLSSKGDITASEADEWSFRLAAKHNQAVKLYAYPFQSDNLIHVVAPS